MRGRDEKKWRRRGRQSQSRIQASPPSLEATSSIPRAAAPRGLPFDSTESSDMTATPASLVLSLVDRARERPDAIYPRYLFPDRDPVETRYREALRRTRQFASLYAAAGVAK